MKTKQVVIVVPFYKNNLSLAEEISWMQMCKVFANREMVLIVPNNLKLGRSLPANARVLYFEPRFFHGREGYNDLMLSSEFYACFLQYEYMLICQLDVFVFDDIINDFICLDFDYIGAPWFEGERAFEPTGYRVVYVGNGGFSLRRVDKLYNLLKEKKPQTFIWEDIYFASCERYIKIAPIEVASRFALESDLKHGLELNCNRLPMGVHGWWRYDLDSIREYIENTGYDISAIQGENFDNEIKNVYRKIDITSAKANQIIGTIFPKITNSLNDIAIWGAGYQGNLIGWILKKGNIENFVYFDKDKVLVGGLRHGKIIFDADLIQDRCGNFVWVIAVEGHEKEMKDFLLHCGVNEDRIIVYGDIVDALLRS